MSSVLLADWFEADRFDLVLAPRLERNLAASRRSASFAEAKPRFSLVPSEAASVSRESRELLAMIVGGFLETCDEVKIGKECLRTHSDDRKCRTGRQKREVVVNIGDAAVVMNAILSELAFNRFLILGTASIFEKCRGERNYVF